MTITRILRRLGLPLLLAAPAARGQEAPPAVEAPPVELRWQQGPLQAELGTRGEIAVPPGHRFADAEDTRKLLELMGNPTSGAELGLIMPASGEWFVVFEFADVGFIKDDEKDKLDADKILGTIRDGTNASNEQRKKNGWPTLEVVGWDVPPRYDAASNNLEWAVRARSEGKDVVNFNTRLLGRKGVMEVNLVLDPEQLEATLPVFLDLLRGFRFKPGERYSEFTAGDKIATYGLTALVAGGAAAVALKTGLLQKFLKPLLIALVALAASLKGWLARLFRRKGGGTVERQ